MGTSDNGNGGGLGGAVVKLLGAAVLGALGAVGLHIEKEAKTRKEAMKAALRKNNKKS